MVAYNFRKQFAEQVTSGKKRQTIRLRNGKRPPRVGDEINLYYGLRTKSCRLLRTVKCKGVVSLVVDVPRESVTAWSTASFLPLPVPIKGKDLIQLARDDGFNTVDEFFSFFRKQYGEQQLDCWLIAWH